ncbi:AraC-like protein [Paraburkholderia rhizosphaerae]|uniref:AraC-like protein n=3 Tax=Paraburkholderia rhizosphaerae TaxID=480658 RepID=A0A4R8L8I9_9BURK|nr:AraC-like protein [Paraburkholderia rhizosphaerae]
MCRNAWIEAMARQGLRCRFDPSHFGKSTKYTAPAGSTDIAKLDVVWQTVSPLKHANTWNHEHLYVQIVTRGTIWIEQCGQLMRLESGDIALIDPLTRYDESVRESASLSVLYVQRSALRERGLRDRFPAVRRPDPASPDVRAVREFVLYLASQAGSVDEALLARLGDQCLDLMNALLEDGNRPGSNQSACITALRAKQLIARRIGDPDLSVASIATELNVSTRTLTRALQANGMSAMRYAWLLRIEHAARLLASTPHRKIQEIACRYGFSDAAHFSREFKKRYDMTPREYAADRNTTRGGASDEERMWNATNAETPRPSRRTQSR